MHVPPVVRVILSALVVGSLAFYVDLHNDGVQAAALVLLVHRYPDTLERLERLAAG